MKLKMMIYKLLGIHAQLMMVHDMKNIMTAKSVIIQERARNILSETKKTKQRSEDLAVYNLAKIIGTR